MSIDGFIANYLLNLSSDDPEKKNCEDSGSSIILSSSSINKIITLPMVYCPDYDIHFYWVEWMHPFDVQKWRKVAQFVTESLETSVNEMLTNFGGEQSDGQNIPIVIRMLQPSHSITDEELSLVHDELFIKNLNKSHNTMVSTSEIWLLYLLPFCVIENCLVKPIRFQSNGTILATFIAIKYGTGINIGGGFHHCSARRSAGFCFIADITLAIRNLWLFDSKYSVLIVDCDAHQGNGYARDVLMMTKQQKKQVYILDLYNPRIYPRDEAAKTAIDREVHLKPRIEDHDYLELLQFHLNAVIENDKFHPDLIIFNAGTDTLRGDRLGRLAISPNGIAKRDEIVFKFAQKHQAKIVMLLSGGYQRSNARVIADSLLNLYHNKLIKPIDGI